MNDSEKLVVRKSWNSSSTLPKNNVKQFEEFRKYLNNCKRIGVPAADIILDGDNELLDSPIPDNEMKKTESFCNNVREALIEIERVVALS